MLLHDRHGKSFRRSRRDANFQRLAESFDALLKLLHLTAGKAKPQMMSAGVVAIEHLSAGEHHSHCLGLWQQPGSGQSAAEPAPNIGSALWPSVREKSLRDVPLQRSHQGVA